MFLLSHFHCCDPALFRPRTLGAYNDLRGVLWDLRMPVYGDKSDNQAGLDLLQPLLNRKIEHWLKLFKWDTQGVLKKLAKARGVDPASCDDDGSVDFTQDVEDNQLVALEVQLGNGGRVQADLQKLKRLHDAGLLALGIIVCFDSKTAATADKGLATYSKYVKALGGFPGLPVVVLGLSRAGSTEVDLKKVPGLLLPQVLGGTGCAEVAQFIAEKLVDGDEPQDILLPDRLLRQCRDFDMRYVAQKCAAFKSVFERVSDRSDVPHQTQLLGMFARAFAEVEETIARSVSTCRASRVASRAGATKTVRKPSTKPALAASSAAPPGGPQDFASNTRSPDAGDLLVDAAPPLPESLRVAPPAGPRRVRKESLQATRPARSAEPTLADRLLAAKGPQTFAMHEALKKAALRAH